MNAEKVKAIVCLSSGLDSLLSAVIMKRLGIDVIGLHCMFRFDPVSQTDKPARIRELIEPFDIPLVVKDTTDDFIKMFLDPDHGYGSEMNPCIDCRLLTLRYARDLMKETDARFVVTGEVVGQRPMTQNKPTIFHIDKISGLKGLILRPLSARLLPVTLPEQKGWVDREKLYDISGRGRKRQIALAEGFGLTDYNQPAGGCILTDPQWAKRAQALLTRRSAESMTADNIQLLRLGRHFWPADHLWIIVGRDEADNRMLEKYQKGHWILHPTDFKGPLVLAEGIRDRRDLNLAARITARYCSRKDNGDFDIHYKINDEQGVLKVPPFEDKDIQDWRV